jgi:hypothetical protein
VILASSRGQDLQGRSINNSTAAAADSTAYSPAVARTEAQGPCEASAGTESGLSASAVLETAWEAAVAEFPGSSRPGTSQSVASSVAEALGSRATSSRLGSAAAPTGGQKHEGGAVGDGGGVGGGVGGGGLGAAGGEGGVEVAVLEQGGNGSSSRGLGYQQFTHQQQQKKQEKHMWRSGCSRPVTAPSHSTGGHLGSYHMRS